MPQKTAAVILRMIPYTDYSGIVHAYTESYGMRAYMVKGLGGKGKRFRKSMFLPLTEIELLAHHNKDTISYLREVKIVKPHSRLHGDIVKQSIALFIAEFLYILLRGYGVHRELYGFIAGGVEKLDLTGENPVMFPLAFILETTRYLGIYPQVASDGKYFDLLEGTRVQSPHSDYWIEGRDLALFERFLGTNFEAFYKLKLKVRERYRLMDIMMDYYRLHLPHFKEPKSKKILHEVFHN